MNKLILMFILVSSGAAAHYEITTNSAGLGENQIVTLENKTKFDLIGNSVKVGDLMPSLLLTTSDLKPYDTTKDIQSVKVYSVLTSVDTPVCEQQAQDLSKFVKENRETLKNIEFYAISADTPFAQQRFIREHSLSDITYLSDSSEHKFGLNTGAQIEQLGLLTRSIIVADKDNRIVHIQRVPELTTIPDLKRAVNVALEIQ